MFLNKLLMESFPFKIKLKFNEDEDNIIEPPNSFFHLNEIIKEKLNLENSFLYYNPENKGKLRIQNENDYFQFIDFCNNYLNKYALKDYEFDLIVSNEEIKSENEEEENEDEENLNEENEDVTKKEKHNKGFKEQKRIYYIKEKKDMQREEQEREEKEKEEEEQKKTENENKKSKKKKKK